MNAPAIIPVQGRPTRVRTEGNPDHPPVVLLHGIGRSLEDWSPQFSRLSREYRVIALDLPGFGYSARIPEPADLGVFARGVLETLDAIGENRPVHVVGNSLGGAIAQQLAVAAPDRVASLVLINSAGFGRETAALIRSLTLPIIGRIATGHPTRASATLTERLAYADRRLVTRERIDHALQVARQPDHGTVLHETACALVGIRGLKSGWRRGLITAVSRHPRPTLAIWGDEDRVLPAHHLNAVRHVYPHAQTQLFIGIGHMPQIECPDELAIRVRAFLTEITTAPCASRSTPSDAEPVDTY